MTCTIAVSSGCSMCLPFIYEPLSSRLSNCQRNEIISFFLLFDGFTGSSRGVEAGDSKWIFSGWDSMDRRSKPNMSSITPKLPDKSEKPGIIYVFAESRKLNIELRSTTVSTNRLPQPLQMPSVIYRIETFKHRWLAWSNGVCSSKAYRQLD